MAARATRARHTSTTTDEATVDAAFAAGLRAAAVHALDVERAAALPTIPSTGRVSIDDVRALWRVLDDCGDEAVALTIVRHLVVDEGSVLLLRHAVSQARTLAEGLEVLARSFRLVSSGDALSVSVEDESGLVVRPIYGPSVRFRVAGHVSLLMLRNEVRAVVDGPITPMHVTLLQPVSPRTRAALADAFGSPVYDGVDGDSLVFAAAEAGRALRRDLACPPDVARALAAAHDALPNAGTLERAVRQQIFQGFPRAPVVEAVAHALATSSRSLQRGLRDENTTFQRIADDVRASFAEALLARGVSATDAALLVGYQDLTAFSRAFKRKTGRPPSAHARSRTTG